MGEEGEDKGPTMVGREGGIGMVGRDWARDDWYDGGYRSIGIPSYLWGPLRTLLPRKLGSEETECKTNPV